MQNLFSKDLFIETINEIKKQYDHDMECSEAFDVILPNDYTSVYDNHWLQDQLIKVVKIAMNDNHKDSWIEYFIWELEFGRKWEKGKVIVDNEDFRLSSVYDLWDLLNIEL